MRPATTSRKNGSRDSLLSAGWLAAGRFGHCTPALLHGHEPLTDDQRAMIADGARERRSKLAVAEKLQRARNVKAGSSMEDSASPIEPKERTRTAVGREAKVPERKLRAAREVKKGARNPV